MRWGEAEGAGAAAEAATTEPGRTRWRGKRRPCSEGRTRTITTQILASYDVLYNHLQKGYSIQYFHKTTQKKTPPGQQLFICTLSLCHVNVFIIVTCDSPDFFNQQRYLGLCQFSQFSEKFHIFISITSPLRTRQRLEFPSIRKLLCLK